VSAWHALLCLGLVTMAVMVAGWRWQCRRENAGIVDVLWAASLGIGAVFLAAVGNGAVAPRALLAVIGGVWGWRLARHLWRRVWNKPEDGRYRQLRSQWPHNPWRWLAFFESQALVVVLFALPFVAVAVNPRSRGPWLAAGALIGLISVLGEATADRQLARFTADAAHRGLTCRSGLWRYSRHPNYFFEWLHWFAYVALAAGSPLWALSWLGPVVMLIFLWRVSGIPWTEAQALRTRGADYRAYQRSTSMFFPWFPRSPDETRS